MKQSVITARVDPRVKKLADRVCASKGLVMARFIEDAILDKIEELTDATEVQKLRREPTRPLSEILKEL